MVGNSASQWFSTGIPGVLASPRLGDAGSTSDKAAHGATSFLCDPGRPFPLPGPQFLYLKNDHCFLPLGEF